MTLSNWDVLDIAAKASSLEERVAGEFQPMGGFETDEYATATLSTWRRLIGGDTPALFERRLALQGISAHTAGHLVGKVRLAEEAALPDWIETFASVVGGISNFRHTPEDVRTNRIRLLDPTSPIPFEDALLPIISAAVLQLKGRMPLFSRRLEESASVCLERSLLRRLSYVCAPALYTSFLTQRASGSLGEIPSGIGHNSPARLRRCEYDAFVSQLLADGYCSFFRKYCVLARLTATVVDFWVRAAEEFLQRLDSDWSDIRAAFSDGIDPGNVVAIRPDLSDHHDGGRSVMLLEFASGLRIIYKPRPASLDVAFFDVVAWCNRQEALLPLKCLTVVERPGYGWHEYVESLPCRDQHEARRFYRRAGILLCLTYFLEGSDFHVGNIIASGEQPVLVDLESLMHPRFTEEALGGCRSGDAPSPHEHSGYSVLRTGLLPSTAAQAGDGPHAASGLGSFAAQPTSFLRPAWNNVNTDAMALSYRPRVPMRQANLPTINGRTLSPGEYVEEVQDGFKTTYGFFMDHRATLLASNGPLRRLAQRPVRVILRSTASYQALLDRTLHPAFLRNGADRSIQIDILSKAFLHTGVKHPLWPIQKIERRDLEQLDIPRFTTLSDDDGLTVDLDNRIEQCFAASGYEAVVERLKNLSDSDLRRQLQLIREALLSTIRAEPERSPAE